LKTIDEGIDSSEVGKTTTQQMENNHQQGSSLSGSIRVLEGNTTEISDKASNQVDKESAKNEGSEVLEMIISSQTKIQDTRHEDGREHLQYDMREHSTE